MTGNLVVEDTAAAMWAKYGLLRGTVRLEVDCTAFASLYEVERTRIVNSLLHLNSEVEHIGSTSVPGLPAKPILDIAVGVRESGLEQTAVELLSLHGYNSFGYLRSAGGHVLDRLIDGRACVIVHVLLHNSFRWRRYLVLRDYLRCNAERRDSYAAAKKQLAQRFADDRRSYTIAKRETVFRLEREAFSWLRIRKRMETGHII